MNGVVFWQALRTGRSGLFWYILGGALIVVIGGLGLSLVATQRAALEGVLQNLPPAVLQVFKISLSSFTTPVGYIAARSLNLLWPIMIIAFCAGSAGGISAMLERGTIHFELSLPISRTRWLLSRIVAGLLGLLLICVVTTAALYAFASADWWRFTVLGAAFGVMWLGVAYAVAAFARDRGKVTGTVFGLFAVQFLLATVAGVVADAAWLRDWNIWSAYAPDEIVLNGLPWVTVALWVGLGVLGFGIALWRWRTRDLPA
jgi:ABC-2 type transport system permease protein